MADAPCQQKAAASVWPGSTSLPLRLQCQAEEQQVGHRITSLLLVLTSPAWFFPVRLNHQIIERRGPGTSSIHL